MSERLGVALFGIGRAGIIHLLNLRNCQRAVVHYIIERDLDRARDIVRKYHMTDTTVVSADDANQVYQDDRFSAMCAYQVTSV